MPINSDFLIKHVRPVDVDAVEAIFSPHFRRYLQTVLNIDGKEILELARAWIATAEKDAVENVDVFVSAANAVSRGRWSEHSTTAVNTVFFLDREQLATLSAAGKASNANRKAFVVDFGTNPIAAVIDIRESGGHHVRWNVDKMIVTADRAGNICHLEPQLTAGAVPIPLAQAALTGDATDPATAGLNAVIDISHNNGALTITDFRAAKAAGIRAVFHKATQGTGFADPMLVPHLTAARNAGLLIGAYHFGTASDPVAQLNFFVDTVRRSGLGAIPLVLDYESNATPATSMLVDQARTFLRQARAQFGRAIGLYSGATIRQVLGGATDPVFAESWLWLPSYGVHPTVQPSWKDWTFWQYTDGKVGPPPHAISGIAVPLDRSIFKGTEEQMTAFWTGAAIALG